MTKKGQLIMGIQHQNRKLEQVNFQSKMPITLVSLENPFQKSFHLGQQNIYPIMITSTTDRFYINYLMQTLFDFFQKF
jgi:hypothetical protein